MSLGSPSVPQTPALGGGNTLYDPYSLAAQQQQYNVGSGIMSQAGSLYNQNTPGWSTNYTQTGVGPGGVPIYSVNQNLTGQNATNYNQYLGNQNWVGSNVPNFGTTGWGLLGQGTAPLNTAAGYQNQGASALGQAMGTLTGPASSQFQTAANTLNNTLGNNSPAMAAFQTGMNTLLGPASAGYAGAVPYFGQGAGYAAQGAGLLGQAGNQVNQFAGQNPASIGNMASGTTGQMMNSAVAGIAPFQQTQRDQLDTQLKNQGLHPGEPGYDNAMRELDTSQNLAISTFMSQFEPQAWNQAMQTYQLPLQAASAYTQAGSPLANFANSQASLGQGQLGVGQGFTGIGGQQIGLGGQLGQLGTALGSAQANLGSQYTNLGNAQSGIGAQYGALSNAAQGLGNTYLGQGLNILNSALPWLASSAPAMPGAPTTPPLSITPTNLAGLGSAYNSALNSNYGNQLSAYNAQLAQQQNALSGLFGIGTSALGGLIAGSDRRLKENIVPVGTLPNGISLYSFNYKWDKTPFIGVMADEVEPVIPDAVLTVNGIKLVDYAKVLQ